METVAVQHDDPFLSPIPEVLVKASEENGEMILYLQASNQGQDDEGETILQQALQKSVDIFMRRGVISWDHLHKIEKENPPQYIIGEPLDVKFSPDGRTLVKSRLYRNNQIAKSVWDNARSDSTRLGSSVGGGILKKSSDGTIEAVVWDEVAITHKPVNAGTYGGVSLVPYAEFMKALMAGAGVDAGSFSGGRALVGESLQGEATDFHNALVKMGETRSRRLINEVGTAILARRMPLDNLHLPDSRVYVIGRVMKSAPDLNRNETLAVADGIIAGLRS